MDPQILEAALLITWSTESNSDKSTPYSSYLIFPLPKYNLTLTSSDMSDSMKKCYWQVDLQLQNISTQSYSQTIISLSRSTLKLYFTKQIYTKTIYLLSRSTIKLLSIRVLPLTRRKTGRVLHLHHLLLTPFSSSPSLSFFELLWYFGWISVLYRQPDASGARRQQACCRRGPRC
jgi:hypothetical protein